MPWAPRRLGTVFPSSTVTNVSGGSDAALFASGTSCAAIDIEGATATVNGTILTNGGIKTRKSSYVFNGPLSYHPGAQTPPCSAPDGSFNSGVTTNGGGNLLPKRWDTATLCAATPNTFTVATAVPAGASGVWCSSVSLTDDQNGAQSITLIAPKVTVNGNGSQSLTASPAAAGLLIDVTGNNELDLRARGAVLRGDLVAPLTTIKIDGVDYATGFAEAKEIVIGASPLDLAGDGPLEGATTTYTTVPVTSGVSALGAAVWTKPMRSPPLCGRSERRPSLAGKDGRPSVTAQPPPEQEGLTRLADRCRLARVQRRPSGPASKPVVAGC